MRVSSKNITKTRFLIDCLIKFLHGLVLNSVFETDWGCTLSCNFNCHLSCNFNCRLSYKSICFNLSCWCSCSLNYGSIGLSFGELSGLLYNDTRGLKDEIAEIGTISLLLPNFLFLSIFCSFLFLPLYVL